MDIIHALILGTVQGITEWLPISSTGHLAITHKILNIPTSAAYDVVLHFGTILAVLLMYWRDFLAMANAVIRLDKKSPSWKMATYIVIATIPAAIIGFLFNDLLESFFENMLVIGIGLIITGILLFLASKTKGQKDIGIRESTIIGFAQAIKILAPGLSRSGMTLSAGMLAGVEKSKALYFSFLMSLPITLGAAIFEARKANLLTVQPTEVIVGIGTSFVVGYVSIKLLISIVKDSKLQYFAYYCFAAGILVIAFLR